MIGAVTAEDILERGAAQLRGIMSAIRGDHLMARGVSMNDWGAGEVGGVFAGVIAALAAAGKGLAWLLNFHGAREDSRSKRNQRWEEALNQREKVYREKLERELASLHAEQARVRAQQAAIGFSLLEAVLELRAHIPASAALTRIRTALRHSFKPEHDVPPEIAELLRALDVIDQSASQR